MDTGTQSRSAGAGITTRLASAPQEPASGYSPICHCTKPTPGDQTLLLQQGASEKTVALSKGLPGHCPFSSSHQVPIRFPA